MSDKIKIISDTNADVPKEYVEKYNIELIPSLITIDDKTYRDFYDINAEQFCEVLRKSNDNTQFSTSQASVEVFLDSFRKWTAEGYKIILFTISSDGSGTYQGANLAKQYLLDALLKPAEFLTDLKIL